MSTLLTTAAVTGNDGAVLDRILHPDVHLVVWQRALPAYLNWVAKLDWGAIEDLDFVAPLDGIEGEIADGLTQAGYAPGMDTAALGDEIALLARYIAHLVPCAALRIRLEVVNTDACRKFHADNVALRLLMTLAGEGTQWVERDADHGAIHQMATGEVGLFKGRLWAEPPGILHRSPPIADKGQTRLLLVIDPVAPHAADLIADGC